MLDRHVPGLGGHARLEDLLVHHTRQVKDRVQVKELGAKQIFDTFSQIIKLYDASFQELLIWIIEKCIFFDTSQEKDKMKKAFFARVFRTLLSAICEILQS